MFGVDAVESVSVLEGDSVSLNSGFTEMMDYNLILWRFGDENSLIAQISVMANSMTVYDDVLDERFRDRLKLDHQTGSLIITNTRTEHTGLYKLQTNSVSKSFSLAVYGELNCYSFKVYTAFPVLKMITSEIHIHSEFNFKTIKQFSLD